MTVFKDELMTCVMCGRQERCVPNISSQWRCIELENRKFYACPNEFPSDDSSAEEFKEAYIKIIKTISQKIRN